MKRAKHPPRSANPHVPTLVKETLLMMRVTEKTEEYGDCLLWTGAVSASGHPIIKSRHGFPCETVRRLVVRVAGDKNGDADFAPRQPIDVTCDEKRCVNQDHLVISSISAIAQKAGDKGSFSGVARGAKIAAARRSQSRLTLEDAAAIRVSIESGPVLSARYGVNCSVINSIKRGDIWKDYSNPFAGLMKA